jgi:uncharacterized membrane protein YjjP (DUF1212 family)
MASVKDEPISMREKMNFILDIGQLLMENGAGSTRVVRDMYRSAAYWGIHWEDIQLHVMYTTIMMNIDDGHRAYTMFRKCYRHGINMTTILEVSSLTWGSLQHNYSYETYREKLDAIKKEAPKSYPFLFTAFCGALASAGFCMIFGGDLWAALFTIVAAFCGSLAKKGCDRLEVNSYVGIAASAFISTLVAALAIFLPFSSHPWLPMVACALTLVPGLSMINAVDDFLNNYLTAGTTRMTHTVLTVLAMTFGIVLAADIWHVPEFADMSIFPERLYILQAVAAAMGAFGFSVLFNVPKRYWLFACLGAVITVDTRNICFVELGMSMAVSSFIGASVFSVLCFLGAKWLSTPAFVIAIPAVIPMIPGVLLYRFLFALIQSGSMPLSDVLLAMRNGIDGLLILLGIAVGITVPDVLCHQIISHRKRKKLEKFLMKRGQGKYTAQEESGFDKAIQRK